MHTTTHPSPPGSFESCSRAVQPVLDTSVQIPPVDLAPRALLGGLAGLLALGAASALGRLDVGSPLRLIPSVLVVELGAFALTTPALLAMHQYLGLRGNVEDLVSALARALVRGGQVAGGLALTLAAFSLTTDLGIVALVAALGTVGVFTTAVGCVELARVERSGGGPHETNDLRFMLVLTAWAVLSWLIALRIGVHVAQWVMGY